MPNHTSDHLARITQASAAQRRGRLLARLISTSSLTSEQVRDLQRQLEQRLTAVQK